ncbi:hypothetical protein CARN8_1300002 [mine drainage metagenome]|uniref:Uncharacterized protein n=1 Tax=mine drainage metagenome TaxID=410659 RepID=A0A3P3ZLK8_9ZZZZ
MKPDYIVKEKYGTLFCARISLEQVSRAWCGADSLRRASGLSFLSQAARVRLGRIRARRQPIHIP